jgi:hypothetical protein
MATTTFRAVHQQEGHQGTLVFERNDVPPSGAYSGALPKGGLVLNMGAGTLYYNTGTIDAPTFAIYGSVLPATVNASALATADPHSTGSLWSNSGVLTVSAG